MKNLSLYDNDLAVPRKKDVDAKQDKITADGILKGDGTGAVSAAETIDVELVDLTKTDVGLGNVDNTSDADKPISTATQTALNGKQATITGGASTITSTNLIANRALVSNANGKVAVSDVTSTELGYLDGVTSNIQTQLNGKLSSAPVASVNGKTGSVSLGAGDVGAVPTSRTVNNKALSANISLTASDVGAVPTSRTVNGKALSSNITLTASDVSAVPTSRTVNGKALSSNITLSASDVGALPTSGGTLTGNLTGKYITGTWLQTTEVSDKAGDFATIDSNGWIYKRTASEVCEDVIRGNSIMPASIELFPGASAGHGGFIDFHYNNNAADFTSRLIEHNGHILYNNSKLLSAANVIAIWNVAVTFTNGIAEYSNNAIKANKPCFVQFRASSVNSSFQNTALSVSNPTDGKLTIVAKNGATFNSNLNILILNF